MDSIARPTSAGCGDTKTHPHRAAVRVIMVWLEASLDAEFPRRLVPRRRGPRLAHHRPGGVARAAGCNDPGGVRTGRLGPV